MTDTPIPIRVFEGLHLRACHAPGSGRQLLVTFDFRKHGRQGFGPGPKPGRLAARGWDHLHLSTSRNDWFLNPDTEPATAALRRFAARFRAVHLLGYSMGAYGALRFAAGIGATRACVVSPFVSLRHDIAPWESRHRADLVSWADETGDLGSRACPDLPGDLIFDPLIAADTAHAGAVQALFPGLAPLSLPRGGHPATKNLRETGRGGAVLDVALGLMPARMLADPPAVGA